MSGLLSDARSINQDIHGIHRQLWKCSDGYPLFELKSSEWTLNTDLLYKEKTCALKLKSIGLTPPIARNLPRNKLNAQSGSAMNAWRKLGKLWLVSRIGWMEISHSV